MPQIPELPRPDLQATPGAPHQPSSHRRGQLLPQQLMGRDIRLEPTAYRASEPIGQQTSGEREGYPTNGSG
jgi:hypothetical protein